MKDRQSVIDLTLIAIIYAFYFLVIWVTVSYNLPGELNVVPAGALSGDDFRAAFNEWAQIVMGVSLILALGWYVLGEWGLKGHTTKPGTWLVIWFGMLALVVVVSLLAIFLGPQASENGLILDLFYVVSGTLFFYLTGVFRSPAATKFLVWPARIVRR